MILELYGPDGTLIIKVPTMIFLIESVRRANGIEESVMPAGTYAAIAVDDNGQRLTSSEVKG